VEKLTEPTQYVISLTCLYRTCGRHFYALYEGMSFRDKVVVDEIV
jgi:hypothetical protein